MASSPSMTYSGQHTGAMRTANVTTAEKLYEGEDGDADRDHPDRAVVGPPTCIQLGAHDAVSQTDLIRGHPDRPGILRTLGRGALN